VDGQSVELYQVLFDGFVAAANQYPNLIDTRKVGFAGHSFGGGATPSLALRAVRERGWGSEGLALFPLAPWYSHQLSNQDLAAFPAHTQLVMQVYEDDVLNDHRMAIDVYRRMNLPAANKDYLVVHSDLIESYPYRSAHSVPSGSELSARRSGGDLQCIGRLGRASASARRLPSPPGLGTRRPAPSHWVTAAKRRCRWAAPLRDAPCGV
jgi:hypothetical protein